MVSKDKGTHEKEVICSDCGKVMLAKDKGLQWHRSGMDVRFGWDACQVCGAIICLDCAYYNRVKRKGLYRYYYDVMRVCKEHYSPKEEV